MTDIELIVSIVKTFQGHAGREGERGGSAPRGEGEGDVSDDDIVASFENNIYDKEKLKGKGLFKGEWPEPGQGRMRVELERPNGVKLELFILSRRDTTTKEVSADQFHQKTTYILTLKVTRPGEKYSVYVDVSRKTVSGKNNLDRALHAKAKAVVLLFADKKFGVKFKPFNLESVGM